MRLQVELSNDNFEKLITLITPCTKEIILDFSDDSINITPTSFVNTIFFSVQASPEVIFDYYQFQSKRNSIKIRISPQDLSQVLHRDPISTIKFQISYKNQAEKTIILDVRHYVDNKNTIEHQVPIRLFNEIEEINPITELESNEMVILSFPSAEIVLTFLKGFKRLSSSVNMSFENSDKLMFDLKTAIAIFSANFEIKEVHESENNSNIKVRVNLKWLLKVLQIAKITTNTSLICSSTIKMYHHKAVVLDFTINYQNSQAVFIHYHLPHLLQE
jgi:hypothetical protein